MSKILFLLLIICSIIFKIKSEKPCGSDPIVDIAMIVDSSGSISYPAFEEARRALLAIVEELTIGPKAAYVSLMSFSSTNVITLNFNAAGQDKNNIKRLISSLPKLDSGTNTASALSVARTQLFNTRRDISAPRIAIVFTDGFSDNTVLTVAEAKRLKDEGIEIFAIGIGGLNPSELNSIASIPLSTYSLSISTFTNFVNFSTSISNVACLTNTYVYPNQPLPVTSKQNQYRYFQVDKTQISPNAMTIVEIEIIEREGKANAYYSLTEKNPTAQQTKLADGVSKINADGTRSMFYTVAIPAKEPRLYFSVLGLEAENKFDVSIIVLFSG